MQKQEEEFLPNMKLPDLVFKMKFPQHKEEAQKKLFEEIKKNNMAPLYKYVVDKYGLKMDEKLYNEMTQENQKKEKELKEQLEDAEKNFGETEISDALLAKAQHFARIGNKDEALSAYRIAFEKAPGVGHKLDIVFSELRIGLFFNDQDVTRRNIEKAKYLIEEGGDWDRRNRLKVYEGVYLLSLREFEKGTRLLLDSLATFTSTEFVDYKQFILYTVLGSVLTLKRSEIKQKVMEAPEVLEVLHQIPHLENYLRSLYNCQYASFFQSLASMESYLKFDYYLWPHMGWYIREMRVIAYQQLLESYSSLTLESMAKAFGVSVEFMDRELSRLIASGRLHCVIDKVSGLVETNRPDTKNAQYQLMIKQGDLLLNRVQKLSRVIHI